MDEQRAVRQLLENVAFLAQFSSAEFQTLMELTTKAASAGITFNTYLELACLCTCVRAGEQDVHVLDRYMRARMNGVNCTLDVAEQPPAKRARHR
jgi:hypothetical protein